MRRGGTAPRRRARSLQLASRHRRTGDPVWHRALPAYRYSQSCLGHVGAGAKRHRQDGLFGELGAMELANEASAVENQDSVADRRELLRVGGVDDDGGASSGCVTHETVNGGLGADIDASGRFVEYEDVRLGAKPL